MNISLADVEHECKSGSLIVNRLAGLYYLNGMTELGYPIPSSDSPNQASLLRVVYTVTAALMLS